MGGGGGKENEGGMTHDNLFPWESGCVTGDCCWRETQ